MNMTKKCAKFHKDSPVNDAFAAFVAGCGYHSPEVLHFGPVLNVQHESLGKQRIIDAADLS